VPIFSSISGVYIFIGRFAVPFPRKISIVFPPPSLSPLTLWADITTIGELLQTKIEQAMASVITSPTAPSSFLHPSPLLDRICKWLSTLVGTDQLIMLIQYSVDIITHHMDVHTPARLLALIGHYFPMLTYPPMKLSSPPSILSTCLKRLSAKLADGRILLRLQGIIPTFQWFLATHASPPSDPTLAKVAKLQTYANLLYYPLENAAYLASHSILPMSKRTESELWLWSSRFWAAYVALEFVRLYRERELNRKGKEVEKSTPEGRNKRWWAQLLINLAYAPQTIHWSIEGGLFRDVEVAYFGVIAAITSIYLAWPTS
jgi:Peroxisomal biogenesis factor 11 (PEX11)